MQGLLSGHKNAYDCIKAFSETDFTEDLKRIDVPTLIVHGDDDQIVPIGNAGLLSAREGRSMRIALPHTRTEWHMNDADPLVRPLENEGSLTEIRYRPAHRS